MAFYKKQQQKVNNKWYPRAVLVGEPVSTDQLALRLASESTLSPVDVLAVLKGLSGIMGEYMAQGRSVVLNGIGSFSFNASAVGNGVDSPEEVSARQINGVKVKFVPETTYERNGCPPDKSRRAVRTLTNVEIEWIDVESIGK